MAAVMLAVGLALLVSSALCDNGGILQIHFPNVSIEADNNGSVNIQSGDYGSIYLVPGPGGAVFFDGENVDRLFDELLHGLPPVWKSPSSVGFFATFRGGATVNIRLEAEDPNGGTLVYKVVAGDPPPGIGIDSTHNAIVGVAPDADAIYSFTVRATNAINKFADAIFRMELIGTNQCLDTPCKNGGVCTDTQEGMGYYCNCSTQYSGPKCEIRCSSHNLGVGSRNTIADAQLSGFLTRSSYPPTGARIGTSGRGWCGSNRNAWLQVDLGVLSRVFGVKEQSYSSSYYTGSYYVSYSDDGHAFRFVGGGNSTKTLFSGSSSSSVATSQFSSPVEARFIRFHPDAYSSSYFPCMRVEVLGCPLGGRQKAAMF